MKHSTMKHFYIKSTLLLSIVIICNTINAQVDSATANAVQEILKMNKDSVSAIKQFKVSPLDELQDQTQVYLYFTGELRTWLGMHFLWQSPIKDGESYSSRVVFDERKVAVLNIKNDDIRIRLIDTDKGVKWLFFVTTFHDVEMSLISKNKVFLILDYDKELNNGCLRNIDDEIMKWEEYNLKNMKKKRRKEYEERIIENNACIYEVSQEEFEKRVADNFDYTVIYDENGARKTVPNFPWLPPSISNDRST